MHPSKKKKRELQKEGATKIIHKRNNYFSSLPSRGHKAAQSSISSGEPFPALFSSCLLHRPALGEADGETEESTLPATFSHYRLLAEGRGKKNQTSSSDFLFLFRTKTLFLLYPHCKDVADMRVNKKVISL